MFKKLLTNLPFNPSLINQVSFYSKRLRQETAIRRVGFGFVALTMLIQIFAVMSPAQASLGCDPSNNDIVQCGFSSKAEAVQHCRDNKPGENYATILAFYNVSCDALNAGVVKTISSTDFSNQLISVGRKAFHKTGEYSTTIPGAGTFFWRPLSSWDNSGPSSYQVVATHSSDNQLVMVMFSCGNLVTLKSFTVNHPQPDSNLKLLKTNSPTGDVKPGDTINYTMAFSNTGGTAAFFSVNDTLPANVAYTNSQAGNWIFQNSAPNLKWVNNTPPYYTFGNTSAGSPGFITLQVKVNNNVPSGTTICNSAYLQDVNLVTKSPRNTSPVQACNTVVIICPTGQVLNSNGTTCDNISVPSVICESLQPTAEPDINSRTFIAKAQPLNGATISSYTYDFGDGTSKVHNSSDISDTITHTFGAAKTYTVSVSLQTSLGTITSKGCQFEVPISKTPTPMVIPSKTAKNITKGINNADGTTANAGDVIEYTVSVKNIGDGVSKNYAFPNEDLTDVLEYADLDTTTLQGGVIDNTTHALSWSGTADLKPSQVISKTFRVTVKNPVPQTTCPPQPDNCTSFDLKMTNSFGNTITINLPPTLVKTTEIATTTIPNTGPGTSIMIAFGVTLVVGYFFARSRLMTEELEIVREEYSTAGGGQ